MREHIPRHAIRSNSLHFLPPSWCEKVNTILVAQEVSGMTRVRHDFHCHLQDNSQMCLFYNACDIHRDLHVELTAAVWLPLVMFATEWYLIKLTALFGSEIRSIVCTFLKRDNSILTTLIVHRWLSILSVL